MMPIYRIEVPYKRWEVMEVTATDKKDAIRKAKECHKDCETLEHGEYQDYYWSKTIIEEVVK